MKAYVRYIAAAAVAGLAALTPAGASAQLFRYNIHIDPITSGLIGAQTSMLENMYRQRIERQDALLAEEAVINLTLGGIHSLQKKTIDYLSNAQDAIKSLGQIAEISRLAVDDIPGNALGLLQEIKNHPQKAALAGINSALLQSIVMEAADLTPLIATLVTSPTVKKDDDGTVDTKSKVNLLNGAERFEVANSVLRRLRMLNGSIINLRWQIQSARVYVSKARFDFISYSTEMMKEREKMVSELKSRYWSK